MSSRGKGCAAGCFTAHLPVASLIVAQELEHQAGWASASRSVFLREAGLAAGFLLRPRNPVKCLVRDGVLSEKEAQLDRMFLRLPTEGGTFVRPRGALSRARPDRPRGAFSSISMAAPNCCQRAFFHIESICTPPSAMLILFSPNAACRCPWL